MGNANVAIAEFTIIGDRKHLLVSAPFWRIQAILKRRFFARASLRIRPERRVLK